MSRQVPTSLRRAILVSLGVVWLVATVVGMASLWRYALDPGDPGAPPAEWPASARMQLASDRPTLLLFIHPHCPCSRATVGELASVMAACRDRVDARVLVLKPEGAGPGWEATDLWRSAAAIPGVAVSCDESGAEARRYGAETSGQVLLYDPSGHLLFHGGITGARGHAGDNESRDELVELILAGAPDIGSPAPVYGCPLHASSDCDEKELPHVASNS